MSAAQNNADESPLMSRTRRQCAFCDQHECSVRYLVAGPDQFICDPCVLAAKALLDAR